MIRFEKMDSEELERMGIAFQNSEEERHFSDTIKEELEVRIWDRISRKLTDDQAVKYSQFNEIFGDPVVDEWLRENCPDYQNLICEVQMELEREIIRYRGEILGAIIISDNITDSLIDDIGLGPQIIKKLTRNNIVTVGDLLECGDLSNIQDLNETDRKDIDQKLRTLMDGMQ